MAATGTLTRTRADQDGAPGRTFAECRYGDLEAYVRYHSQLVERRLLNTDIIQIEYYRPFIHGNSSWLGRVEERIRNSTTPGKCEKPSARWLTSESAAAAIEFFRTAADVLPSEPHIYASNQGDLVAEFVSQNGQLTAVVTTEEIVLFAVNASRPERALQSVVARGSRQLLHELASITKELGLGRDGTMGASR